MIVLLIILTAIPHYIKWFYALLIVLYNDSQNSNVYEAL